MKEDIVKREKYMISKHILVQRRYKSLLKKKYIFILLENKGKISSLKNNLWYVKFQRYICNYMKKKILSIYLYLDLFTEQFLHSFQQFYLYSFKNPSNRYLL